MLAKRIVTNLSPLSFEEALEDAKFTLSRAAAASFTRPLRTGNRRVLLTRAAVPASLPEQ
jgi:molecular chaperone DnaK (HSP70)